MKSLAFKRACLAGMGVAVFVAGCELIVNVDRTQIPGGGFDGSVDSPGIDSPVKPLDAQADVRADAAPDAPDASDAALGTDGDATTGTDASDGSTGADADDGSVADADDSG